MSQHVIEQPPVMAYRVAIRAHTDIRNPAPAFLAALAGQFERAADIAEGRLCVSVPGTAEGDDTPGVVSTLLHAAAAHQEAVAGTAVKVEITDACYSGDGYCHVFASCYTTAAVELNELGQAVFPGGAVAAAG